MSKLTLFYDADCGFCSASVDWITRQAASSNLDLATIPYQDPSGPAKFPGIDWEHNDRGVQTLDERGVVKRDSSALATCLKAMPAWNWLGTIMDLPILRLFIHLGYKVVAKNRRHISRWLGMTQCKIPARPVNRA